MAEFASNAKANLGVTLGAIGSGLQLLNNTNGLNIFGNNNNYATKDDLDHAIILAQKDSQISLLKANAESEKKMIDVYERVQTNINSFKQEQRAINAQQAVFNSTATSGISVLQTQTAQLMGLCKMVIPNSNVCPGWGAVTISPAGGTTTA